MTVLQVTLDLGPKDDQDPDRDTRRLTFQPATKTWTSSDGRAFPRELKLMLEIHEAVRRYDGKDNA